jgi:hypothetical protein
VRIAYWCHPVAALAVFLASGDANFTTK